MAALSLLMSTPTFSSMMGMDIPLSLPWGQGSRGEWVNTLSLKKLSNTRAKMIITMISKMMSDLVLVPEDIDILGPVTVAQIWEVNQ